MAKEHRTPYADDALRVENGTEPEEVQQFVMRRAINPHAFGDVKVWNFNNHVINKEALEQQADDLLRDEYVIPYQASGVWGYMVSLMPSRLRHVEILTYQQDRGRYVAYPNYLRHSDVEENYAIRKQIEAHLSNGI